MDEKLLFGLCIALAIVIGVVSGSHARNEADKWDTFVKEHNCYIISERKGSDMVGVTSNGSVAIVSSDDEVCYQCDDGKQYWRAK